MATGSWTAGSWPECWRTEKTVEKTSQVAEANVDCKRHPAGWPPLFYVDILLVVLKILPILSRSEKVDIDSFGSQGALGSGIVMLAVVPNAQARRKA